MLRRYRKLKEDMPLSAAKIEDNTLAKRVFCIKTNVIYLLLSSSISLYLQGKRTCETLEDYLYFCTQSHLEVVYMRGVYHESGASRSFLACCVYSSNPLSFLSQLTIVMFANPQFFKNNSKRNCTTGKNY